MNRIKAFFRRDNIGLLFALPAVVYMLVFVGYPIVHNIILGFQDVDVMNFLRGQKHFIGFENYVQLFHDEVFFKSVTNTFVFTVSCLVFQFLIGFALALFFNRKFSLARPVRGILMMPWMIPMTVTALMFKFMFSTKVGVINNILTGLGIVSENIEWLTSIVDLCNAHNVRPVIVLMPVMGEYKEKLPKEQIALMEDVLQSLDSCAICIDASEWPIPDDGWYNATHLTKEASEELTRKIVEF